MKQPVRVSVTGAAGNISYSLLFKIAAGELFGLDQPVIFQLLEISQAMNKLTGVAMELEDCAFPLVHGIHLYDSPFDAFKNTHYAMLVGSRPRSAGMERSELLEANAKIFAEQGRALNAEANCDVKALVVGNPANTNCLILARNAPDLHPSQFSAMMRLDHNRVVGALSKKLEINPEEIDGVCVWGNHSPSMYPDVHHAVFSGGQPVLDRLNQEWYFNELIPNVQKRGAEIIEWRGLSSAASAAQAALDNMRDWVFGSDGAVVSMAVASDGSYGLKKGIYCGFPVVCEFGSYRIVQDFPINDYGKVMIGKTEKELLEEKGAIEHLLPKETESMFMGLEYSERKEKFVFYRADKVSVV